MPASHLQPTDLEYCPCCYTTAHILVRQDPYVCTQGGSMEHFEDTTITFRKEGKCGIPVEDGISKSYNGLDGRDSRPFERVDVSNLPALKIKWPGYPDWTGNFRTRGTTPARIPVTLSCLATNLCNNIGKFVEEMSGETCTKPDWRVGPGHLEVKDLVLLSLERASIGTWVMSIQVLLPPGEDTVAGMQG